MKVRLTVLLITVGIAGVAAASFLASSAFAWSPTNLPPGWTYSHGVDVAPGSACPEWYKLNDYTNGVLTDVSGNFCTNSPSYQSDFDAWVNARYTAPVTTTAAAPATTTTATTVQATTPAPTTTATSSTPAPAAPAQTTTAATTTAPACDVQCQIADLQAQINALHAQLTQLIQILETWPGIDPGILAQLMALG